jgi:hypothetical protein
VPAAASGARASPDSASRARDIGRNSVGRSSVLCCDDALEATEAARVAADGGRFGLRRFRASGTPASGASCRGGVLWTVGARK